MTAMTGLAPHRLAGLIPEMTAPEFHELRDDIAANGLKQPIVLFEDQILDGRHRYLACEQAGVEPEFTTYTGDKPVAEVISLNIKRRHLTPSQRAALVAPMVPELEAEYRETHPHGGSREPKVETFPPCAEERSRNGKARDFAGQLAGVSGRTVKDAHVVYEQAPELHKKVLNGEMSVDTAAKEVRRRRQDSGEKPKAAPQKVSDDGPLEGRRLMLAKTAKERMAGVIGTCQAWDQALNDIQVELAMRLMTTDDIDQWRQHVKAARKALATFERRLAKETADE